MTATILQGDCRDVLATLPDQSAHCIVTSPPYFGLRDYGVAGQIGLEETPDAYVAEIVAVFREARRVLRDDGTLWLNLGDSYAGSWGAQGHRVTESDDPTWHSSQIKNHPKRARQTGTIRQAGLKPKDLIGIPWRVAFALQADGWYLRKDIIWHKPNPMPESVTDRPTSAHEHMFLLAKSERYYFDAEAVKEPATDIGRANGREGRSEDDRARPPGSNPRTLARLDFTSRGRNIRDVWTVTAQPFSGAHFATFPPKLIEPCIKAGSPVGGTVLDPFGGSGTTGVVATLLGRDAILIELNSANVAMAAARIRAETSTSALDAAKAKAEYAPPRGDAPLFAEIA